MTLPTISYLCQICEQNVDRLNEYAYMLVGDVWKKGVARGQRRGLKVSTTGLLCIGCFEQCLGRRLRPEDFADVPLSRGIFPQSRRLQSRLPQWWRAFPI